jgi:hypothetical protein
MPLYIGLLTANLRGRALQGAGTAIILGFGNCANFVSSNVFITTQAPHYHVGFGTGLGLTAFALPVMGLLMFVFITGILIGKLRRCPSARSWMTRLITSTSIEV